VSRQAEVLTTSSSNGKSRHATQTKEMSEKSKRRERGEVGRVMVVLLEKSGPLRLRAPPCDVAAAALEGADAKGLGGMQGCCGERF